MDMVGIVQKMGKKAYGQDAKIQLRKIPAEYMDYYDIAEYDGNEHVIIEYDRFKVDAVISILKDKVLNKADQLARIAAVVNLGSEE